MVADCRFRLSTINAGLAFVFLAHGTLRALARFNVLVLAHNLEAFRVRKAADDLALRGKPEPRAALARGGNAVVGDGLAHSPFLYITNNGGCCGGKMAKLVRHRLANSV